MFALYFVGNASISHAQNGVKAFGVQFKPIFPLGIVNTDGETIFDNVNGTQLDITTRGAYSFGAVIRMGLTKRFSLETGINYIQRNYDFKLSGNDFKASEASVRMIGYEIPIIGMVFVRLGEQMYMNAATGFTFDLFPTGGVASYDRDSIEYGLLESNWIVPALSANLGFEYRTKEHGYFYIGSSYHLPFQDIAAVYISYRPPGTNNFVQLVQPEPNISGTYLTIDLRYFFNPGMKEKRER